MEQTDMRFDRWIKYVFDHPITPSGQHWDLDEAFWDGTNGETYSPATTVTLLTETFERSGKALLRYSNAQVNQGLYYLIHPGCSNFMFDVLDTRVPWADRRKCLQSIYTLFAQCLAQRCSSHLSHLNELGIDPLNAVCYMWWDISPLTGIPNDSAYADIAAELLSIMKQTLYLESEACRESALHGLGHWRWDYPEVTTIIDEFLARSTTLRPELKAYALRARTGGIL